MDILTLIIGYIVLLAGLVVFGWFMSLFDGWKKWVVMIALYIMGLWIIWHSR